MKYLIYFILTYSFFVSNLSAQTIPNSRITDWSGAGASIQIYDTAVNIMDFGADSLGGTDNSIALTNAMASMPNGGTVLFPPGTFLFNGSQSILNGIRIKGSGANLTTINFNNGGVDDCFDVVGTINNAKDTVISGYLKDSTKLKVKDANAYQVGEYIKFFEDNNGRTFSSWARNSLGQIVEITQVDTTLDIVQINQPLRQTYTDSLFPRISKITPAYNVSFECFTINRVDMTSAQTNNFNFSYAAHCMVQGVKSYFSNFAHVRIQNSTNVTVGESFFKNGHDYGGGGKAYGVVMQATAGYNLIENNIFEHLRHSVLLQSSANGNVIAYNYSRDPYWTGVFLPSNSAGDLVLHGNYAYMNLFEGNIVQNIVIDNSHGINGPHNTFFRNRAELYGIVMNNSPASDAQNFVANDIINTTTGFYALAGTNHFEYGNRHHGTITPAGTDSVPEKSYYLSEAPIIWNNYTNWPSLGVGKPYNTGSIPAKLAYQDSILVNCLDDTLYYDFLLCPNDTLNLGGRTYFSTGTYVDSVGYFRGGKRYLAIDISQLPKPQITTYSTYLEADSSLSYQWYLGGNKLVGDTNRRLSYTQNGYYKAWVTTSEGCSQFTDSVLVSNASVFNVVQSDFKVYPNPASNLFFIEHMNDKVNIELYDAQGKLMLSKSLMSKKEAIHTHELSPGIYFLTIQSEDTASYLNIVIQ